MKQTFIFAIILLTTLSMVNAFPHQLDKRATTFVTCPSGSPNQINVSIQPDPPVSNSSLLITVSGTLTTGTIDPGSQFVFRVLDDSGAKGDPYTMDICTAKGITCPMTTGTSFSIVNNVPTGTLGMYTIFVFILDSAANILACSMGTVNGA
jgi:hypothetical protein